MQYNDRTEQSNRSRSLPQEMQQAYVDWVKDLPLVTKDVPEDPDRKHPEDVSAGQTSAPHPTLGKAVEDPPDTRE